MRARLLSMALILGIATVSSTALAQDLRGDDRGYLAPKLVMGFGGEGEIELEDVPGDGEGDLEFTYGIGGAYMHPLHEYFALGGQLLIASWQSEAGENADLDRNSYFDIQIVPQVKVAVTDIVELYGMLPIGLSFDFLGEDGFGGAEVDTGVGFSLSLLFGARVALDDSWGLLGELGYAHHSFTHGTEALGMEGPDLDVSLGQLALNIGAWFAL